MSSIKKIIAGISAGTILLTGGVVLKKDMSSKTMKVNIPEMNSTNMAQMVEETKKTKVEVTPILLKEEKVKNTEEQVAVVKAEEETVSKPEETTVEVTEETSEEEIVLEPTEEEIVLEPTEEETIEYEVYDFSNEETPSKEHGMVAVKNEDANIVCGSNALLNSLMKKYDGMSLKEILEDEMKLTLTEEEKERYSTILEDSREILERGEEAFRNRDGEEFGKVMYEIKNNDYLGKDDVIALYGIMYRNQFANRINETEFNPRNYALNGDTLLIDGEEIKNTFSEEYTTIYDPFTPVIFEDLNMGQCALFLENIIRDIRLGKDLSTDEVYFYSISKLSEVCDTPNFDITRNEDGTLSANFSVIADEYSKKDSPYIKR